MVVLGMWLYQWIVDRLNDGPSVRRFRALAAKLRNCQEILLLFFDAPTPSEIERSANASSINVQIKLVFEELSELDIWFPPFQDVRSHEEIGPLASYLSGMGTLAETGNLIHARTGTMERQAVVDSAKARNIWKSPAV